MKKEEKSSLTTLLGSATRPSNPCMHLCVCVYVCLCVVTCAMNHVLLRTLLCMFVCVKLYYVVVGYVNV
jgi:hypothetical protein